MFIDVEFQVTTNHLHQTLPTFYKQWSISVNIMPIGILTGENEWGNILRVGLGGDREEYGDRTPAIWFTPSTTKMSIYSAINGDSEYFIETDPIPINAWAWVEMSQVRQPDGVYQFTIRMAGAIIHQIINTDPREFSDVKIYTSDNYWPAANAKIANLTIKTFPDNINLLPTLTPTLSAATSTTIDFSIATVESPHIITSGKQVYNQTG